MLHDRKMSFIVVVVVVVASAADSSFFGEGEKRNLSSFSSFILCRMCCFVCVKKQQFKLKNYTRHWLMLKTLHKSVDIFATDCRCLKAVVAVRMHKREKKRTHPLHTFFFFLFCKSWTNERVSATYTFGIIV